MTSAPSHPSEAPMPPQIPHDDVRIPRQRPPAEDDGPPQVREAERANAAGAELLHEGDAPAAVRMFDQALKTCVDVLGGDHPDTLRAAGNLAVARFLAGDGRRGLRELAAAVAAREKVYGPDHPETLNARSAEAVAHRLAGDADAALALAKDVVVRRSRTLGAVHEDTLTSRIGLAAALAVAGDAAAAHRIVSATLTAAAEALGPDHPRYLALIEYGESAGLIRLTT
ncbi:MAG: tetratricopeptide repeat protein [Pseudonocardia sp.]